MFQNAICFVFLLALGSFFLVWSHWSAIYELMQHFFSKDKLGGAFTYVFYVQDVPGEMMQFDDYPLVN